MPDKHDEDLCSSTAQEIKRSNIAFLKYWTAFGENWNRDSMNYACQMKYLAF